jgi:hypothetical protein
VIFIISPFDHAPIRSASLGQVQKDAGPTDPKKGAHDQKFGGKSRRRVQKWVVNVLSVRCGTAVEWKGRRQMADREEREGGQWNVAAKEDSVYLERVSENNEPIFSDSLEPEEARQLARLLTKHAEKLIDSDQSSDSDKSGKSGKTRDPDDSDDSDDNEDDDENEDDNDDDDDKDDDDKDDDEDDDDKDDDDDNDKDSKKDDKSD